MKPVSKQFLSRYSPQFLSFSFTLIEMLAVMLIIGILANLLVWSLAGVRERARRLQCMNNLRQIGLAVKVYASDYHDLFPESGNPAVETHFRLLSNMLQNIGLVFKCPSDFNTLATNSVIGLQAANISFGYVRGLKDTDSINVPMAFDKGVDAVPSGSLLTSFVGKAWIDTSAHKTDGGNVLYSGAYVAFDATFPDNVGYTNVVTY
jgi:prepilin-type N-terminal cleavage/methylation domain-containing protein